MTATLQPSRRRELEAAGLDVYPRVSDRALLADLDAAERRPRYSIESLDGQAAALSVATASVAADLRVLWVVNTVARAQALARCLEALLGRPVLCYHSRFRLRDRKTIHDAAVRAFRGSNSSTIAVTTQVCEMSLDLDADVLLTEAAPASSLVQRMGRANRHGARGPAFLARVLVYEPASAAPYERQDVAAGGALVDELAGRPVSQRELAESLERHVAAERSADGSSRFLEGGYFAVPGSFRDADEPGHPALLDTDVEAAASLAARSRAALQGFLLSVPARLALVDFPRPRWMPAHVLVAPGSRYDERYGFDSATAREQAEGGA